MKTDSCKHVNDDLAPCTDGNACTADKCKLGACIATPKVCDDKLPCTTDSCNTLSGDCTVTNDDSASCTDGLACTTGDKCVAGKCVVTPKVCDDGKPCTKDSCVAATGNCAVVNDNTLKCTGTEKCKAYTCSAGSCVIGPLVCNDSNPCTKDSCDIATGACTFTPDDASVCTGTVPCNNYKCNLGKCEGTPKVCDDGKQCTKGACYNSGQKAGQCTYLTFDLNGTCSDGSACTTGDKCAALGLCVGINKDCNDDNQCTYDKCYTNSGNCYHEFAPSGAPCSDGKACTTGDSCQTGKCAYKASTCP